MLGVGLAILGVINSLISAFYYLRVVYMLYMRPLPRREPAFPASLALTAAAGVAALAVVLVGLFPAPMIRAAQTAAQLFLR